VAVRAEFCSIWLNWKEVFLYHTARRSEFSGFVADRVCGAGVRVHAVVPTVRAGMARRFPRGRFFTMLYRWMHQQQVDITAGFIELLPARLPGRKTYWYTCTEEPPVSTQSLLNPKCVSVRS